MPSVLYIDANVRSAQRMERTLRAAGYEAIHASSGLTAIELSTQRRPDLIAVAAPLDDLDVRALTLRLRGIPELKDKPIIVLDHDDGVMDALAVGATGGIPRNGSPSAVVRSIARYLGGERDKPDESSEIRLRLVSEGLAERLESKIRALQKANHELEHHARIRSDLLRNLTHELATPLTPALGYLAMLQSAALGPLDPKQLSAIDAVAQSLGRIERVTSMLRDVNALESDGLPLHRSRIDTERLAAACRDGFAARGESIDVVVLEDVEFRADLSWLVRAIDRVVENARKFSTNDAPIAVQFDADRDSVRAVVVDCGPGIPAERIGRVGDMFHQVDGSATRRHGGVGLGLAFARRVAEAHGGSLTVACPPSRPIAGRVFTGTEVTLRWRRG